MTRRKKPWQVRGRPGSAHYKPAGATAKDQRAVTLSPEEYEALRLIDHEGLDQQQASKLAGTSQPTLSRALTAARRKLAGALARGDAIIIEGTF